MPHQCTKCGAIYPDASAELLTGCNCGSRFFYYIKQERVDQLMNKPVIELTEIDRVKIEKDIREITGMDEDLDIPVILDFESIRVLEPGKFEIDLVNLMKKERPVIYNLEEGKYIIDLSAIKK